MAAATSLVLACVLVQAMGLQKVALEHSEGPFDESQYDSCRCLNWDWAYKHPAVGGDCQSEDRGGPEWHFYEKLNAFPSWEIRMMIGDEVCRKMFWKLPGNACVNVDFMSNPVNFETDQWCYVDSMCTELGNGAKLTEMVSWKTCKSDTDELLQEKSVAELKALSTQADIDIGLLAKFAYPTWQGQTWSSMRGFWTNETSSAAALFPDELELMNQYFQSGKKMVWDSGESHPDKTDVMTWGTMPWTPSIGITMGKTAWELNYASDMAQKWTAGLVELSASASAFTKLDCLAGPECQA